VIHRVCSSRLVATVFVAAALLCAPSVARSQSTASESTATPTPARRLEAGWTGFSVRSLDGANLLVIDGQLRTDGRFAPGSQPSVTTTEAVNLRWVRVSVSGRVARHITFRYTQDVAGDRNMSTMYVEVPIARWLHVRLGKDKTQTGLEVLQPDGNVWFLERGTPAGLLPSRDLGVQAVGEWQGGAIAYAAGVFEGVVDGTSSNSQVNAKRTGGPDSTARLVVRPFVRRKSAALAGLGFGVGGTIGRQGGAALPSFKTSVEQSYFTYAPDATADGTRTRITPHIFYNYKTVGAFAEYARSAQRVTRGTTHALVANQAWQVAGLVTLTGETGATIRPAHPFDPLHHEWLGALQLTARYGELLVGRDAFVLGLASSSASRRAREATLGVIWYLNGWTKIRLNYEHVGFDGGARRPVQNTLLYRLQIDY
jgi:phosphate-selective porin OprO and OprP